MITKVAESCGKLIISFNKVHLCLAKNTIASHPAQPSCSKQVWKPEGQPAVQIDLPFPDIPVWEEQQHIDASISCQYHALCYERPKYRTFPNSSSQKTHPTNSIYKSLAERCKYQEKLSAATCSVHAKKLGVQPSLPEHFIIIWSVHMPWSYTSVFLLAGPEFHILNSNGCCD